MGSGNAALMKFEAKRTSKAKLKAANFSQLIWIKLTNFPPTKKFGEICSRLVELRGFKMNTFPQDMTQWI